MFYNFGRYFQQYATSLLDPLLERKDITLEQILDEENILNEIKNMGSNKFANYVIKNPEVYQQMIKYVVDYDENVVDKKKVIQYQFLVSEILGNENMKLIEFLFGRVLADDKTDQDDTQESNETPQPVQTTDYQNVIRVTLLPQLFKLLDKDSICVTTAGYFQKVVLPLIKKRGHELWAFFKENPEIISNFIKHLDENHIAEIVEKLILLDTQSEPIDKETYSEERLNLLKRVMNYMINKQHCSEIVENVSDILNEIVSRGRNVSSIYNAVSDVQLLIDHIKSRVVQLFKLGTKSQQAGPYTVLCSLLEENSEQPSQQEDDVVNTESEIPEHTAFLDIIPLLSSACLEKSLYNNQFVDAGGVHVQPLGLAKMQVVRLIHQLLSLKDHQINEKMIKIDIFRTLILLVGQQKGHNQLHLLFEKIVRLAIESDDSDLQQSLFDADLLEFIVDKSMKTSNFGSKGILTKISNFIIEKSKTNGNIQEYIQQKSVNPSVNPAFPQYMNLQLKKINELERNWLCGINPRSKPSYEDEDAQESDVQKILEVFKASYEQRFNHPRQVQQKEEVLVVEEAIESPDVYERMAGDSDEELIQICSQSPFIRLEDEEVQGEYLMNQYWSHRSPHDQKQIDKILCDYN